MIELSGKNIFGGYDIAISVIGELMLNKDIDIKANRCNEKT